MLSVMAVATAASMTTGEIFFLPLVILVLLGSSWPPIVGRLVAWAGIDMFQSRLGRLNGCWGGDATLDTSKGKGLDIRNRRIMSDWLTGATTLIFTLTLLILGG